MGNKQAQRKLVAVPTNKASLCALPPVLVLDICMYVHPVDVSRAMQTSRRWHRVLLFRDIWRCFDVIYLSPTDGQLTLLSQALSSTHAQPRRGWFRSLRDSQLAEKPSQLGSKWRLVMKSIQSSIEDVETNLRQAQGYIAQTSDLSAQASAHIISVVLLRTQEIQQSIACQDYLTALELMSEANSLLKTIGG